MSSEFELMEEPKDRTKLLWLGVVVLMLAAVIALWVVNSRQSDTTRVRAKHILVKCRKDDPVDRARALKLINEIRDRLKNGESFSKLAKDYSDDEMSAARGGDLGYYQRNSLDPAFEAYAWTGAIGELSDVIQSAYGFHLIIVTDRSISKTDQYEMDLEKKAKEAPASSSSDAPAPAK